MEEHVSKRLDESDNHDEDDEGEEPTEATEAIMRAISDKYSNGRDEEDAALKKQRTDPWYIVKVGPSSNFSESSMDDSKEKSGMTRKEGDDVGGHGNGPRILRSFSRKEFVGATKPPLTDLPLQNDHRNSDPEAASIGGSSDQTTHSGEIRDDNPSELMAAVPVDETEEHHMPAMLQETLIAVPISEDNGRKGIWSLTAGLFRSDDDSKEESGAVPSVPQTAATPYLLADLLRDSVEDTTPWENTTTLQYKALDWLTNDDAWLARSVLEDGSYNIPIGVLVERYALVVFSMTWGDKWWSEEFGMLDEKRSSCEWNNGQYCFPEDDSCVPVSGAVCDEDGFVIAAGEGAGEIPTELLLLSSLEYLMLDSNRFSGTIPSELVQLPKLEVLSLRKNSLTGHIPSEIGLAANLRQLNLGYNEIAGTIPSEIGQTSNLRLLNLEFNNIAGILDEVVNPGLKLLDLSDNLVEGTIPQDFGTMTMLERLRLQDNKLSGTLPPTLGNLRFMEELHLYGNYDLTGTVPATMLSLDMVEYVNLKRTNVTNAQLFCSNSPIIYVDCEDTAEFQPAVRAQTDWLRVAPEELVVNGKSLVLDDEIRGRDMQRQARGPAPAYDRLGEGGLKPCNVVDPPLEQPVRDFRSTSFC
eukprot:scaffold7064_cov111-Cylindrotheca_fusiformis.AAC.5